MNTTDINTVDKLVGELSSEVEQLGQWIDRISIPLKKLSDVNYTSYQNLDQLAPEERLQTLLERQLLAKCGVAVIASLEYYKRICDILLKYGDQYPKQK